MLDIFAQDLRNAVRSLSRDWRVSLTMIATLAPGIAATTAVFGAIDAIVLRPLPYEDPQRLAWITEGDFPSVMGRDLDEWQRSSQSFDALAGVTSTDVTLSGDDPIRVRALGITESLGRTFGVTPAAGRDFTDGDFRSAPVTAIELAPPGGTAIISDRLFRQRFRGDSSVLGQPLLIGRAVYTIVGVTPSNFELPVGLLARRGVGPVVSPAVIVAMRVAPDASFGGAIIGRMHAGATLDTARAELERIRSAADRSRDPQRQTSALTLRATALHEHVVGGVRRALVLLLAAGGFLLLIAAFNVTALSLARGASRAREFSVRAALGASRSRLVRQAVTESAVLGSIAGIIASAIASFALRLAANLQGADVPRLAGAAVDSRGALFTFAVCSILIVIVGTLPAFIDSQALFSGLLGSGHRTTSSPHRLRFQRALVTVEIALALILLTGAGLMVRSFAGARTHADALMPDAVLSMRVEPNDLPVTAPPADRLRFSNELLRRLSTESDVVAAALWSTPFIFGMTIDGLDQRATESSAALWVRVTPDFGRAAGVRLVAGRWFTAQDGDRSSVVLSQTFVNRLPGTWRDPAKLIGRTVGGPANLSQSPWTIVGVATDFRTGTSNGTPLDDDVASYPQVYFPDAANPGGTADLLIRTTSDPAAAALRLRAAIASTRRVNVVDPQTLESAILSSLASRMLQTGLLTTLASLALAMALVGIAGLLWYAVAEREHEIGVRMAVGARRSDVLQMVVRQGIVIIGLGIGAGLVGSLWLTRLMTSLLYAVAPADIVTYATVGALMLFVGLCAILIPAWRATRVDSMVVLRYD